MSGARVHGQSVAADVEVLRIEPHIFAYCGWRNFSIGVWVGQATRDAVENLLAMSREMEVRFPQGRSSVVFVLDKVPAPTPEARDAFARVFRPSLSCTALVLEGDGFWASGIRSMSANVHRSSDSPALMRVHTDVEQVVAWLPREHLNCTGVSVSPDVLGKALRSIRRMAERLARETD